MHRLAERTSWAHGAMVAYAKVGIVAFAAMLVLGWWRARSGGDLDVMGATAAGQEVRPIPTAPLDG